MITPSRLGTGSAPKWRSTNPGLVPVLEDMLADTADPDRQAELKTAIEDLKAGRVAVLL